MKGFDLKRGALLTILAALGFYLLQRNLEAASFSASVNVANVCVTGCRLVNVANFGVKPNDNRDDSAALNQVLKQHNKNVVLQFPPGVYHFKTTVQRDGLQNVVFQGGGAELRKMTPFKGEYLLYSRFSRNVAVRNLTFRGTTRSRTQYQWGESGLYLASSGGIVIENNRFFDFGDAAIRVTTSSAGGKGVQSADTAVRNNTFENVTQITTTSNQNEYGGTFGYLLENNAFSNLKGSVKFATRMPGAGSIIVRNNRITGVPSIQTSNGIEVSSYSNVFIQNNQIANCGSYGMNIYTNNGAGIRGFDWGNYSITGNAIRNCPRGIRVSAQAYRTGYKPKVGSITISGNTLDIGNPKQAIQLVNGQITPAVVKNNRIL